jgi:cell division protein FtsW
MRLSRLLVLLLVALPALGLGILGVVLVTSTTARQGELLFGNPTHFAVRQVAALAAAVLLALVVARAGSERLLRSAHVVFVAALLAALAVFVPGVGVRAAGASRWLRVGPLTGSPAPFLIGAVALLTASWGLAPEAPPGHPLPRRTLAVTLALLAALALVGEPDFSAAAVALLVTGVALAGVGARWRRLAVASVVLAIVLGVVASRFGYVGGRVDAFLAPKHDRLGRGFEVLELARAKADATSRGVGLGHGTARRRLSSPGSDYVFAVVTEEMGRVAAGGVVIAWAGIAAGVALAARRRRDHRERAAALAAGAAILAPVAMHIAVCRGWLPIIGVTMPLVSYDPSATVAAGAELGLVAAVALGRPAGEPSAEGNPADVMAGAVAE